MSPSFPCIQITLRIPAPQFCSSHNTTCLVHSYFSATLQSAVRPVGQCRYDRYSELLDLVCSWGSLTRIGLLFAWSCCCQGKACADERVIEGPLQALQHLHHRCDFRLSQPSAEMELLVFRAVQLTLSSFLLAIPSARAETICDEKSFCRMLRLSNFSKFFRLDSNAQTASSSVIRLFSMVSAWSSGSSASSSANLTVAAFDRT